MILSILAGAAAALFGFAMRDDLDSPWILSRFLVAAGILLAAIGVLRVALVVVA